MLKGRLEETKFITSELDLFSFVANDVIAVSHIDDLSIWCANDDKYDRLIKCFKRW